jgi:hypothetical protein
MLASVENLALSGSKGNVWSVARGALNSHRRQGYAGFLTDDQKARLARIRQARLLFNGQHREYFLIEQRTAFDFPYVKVLGINQRMYLTYNVLGLISIKSTDLLFGQSPLFDCDDERQFEAIQDYARRTQLHANLIDAAISGSYEGSAYLESCIHTDGQVYTRQVPSDTIFPVGEVQPDGQYESYVRYSVRNAGTQSSPIWLLLETTISPGKITRACWQLDADGRKVKQLALSEFDPSLDGKDSMLTGISQNTIVWVPNLLGREISDYDCAIELQDALNAFNTQISRVLAKHSDPKIAFPGNSGAKMADPQGNVPAMAEAFFPDSLDEIPKYITWDANLVSAIQNRAETLNNLLVRTETSPVLLGLDRGAAPQAYKSLRLQSFNSLTKAARRSIIWTSAVQRILDVAMALENTKPGVSYPMDPVGVTLRDGIPVDESEQANTISTLRTAGVMSVRRAVRIQLGDEEATDAEVAEIESDAAKGAPSITFGDSPHSNSTKTSDGSEDEEQTHAPGAAE